MADNPLVTIIVPAYNMADLTVRTVESILKQTYESIEIIVVDDGSSDDTQERMGLFGDKITYIRKENGGACSARNEGIQKSHGKYIGCLDCDDLYAENKVELSVEFLEKHTDCGAVHTGYYLVDGDDNILREKTHRLAQKVRGWIAPYLIQENFIGNPTVFFRRECVEKVGMFNESLFPPADWDMWLRIAEQYKFGYIDKPLSQYRVISQRCFGDLERSRKEWGFVLDEFFKRNPSVHNRVKAKAYANFHLSMAESYLVKDNVSRMKEEYILSLKANCFNFKAIALCFYYLFAKKTLKRHLSHLMGFID
jgi:glycosyltransferase involved in cell wall biosynthesis